MTVSNTENRWNGQKLSDTSAINDVPSTTSIGHSQKPSDTSVSNDVPSTATTWNRQRLFDTIAINDVPSATTNWNHQRLSDVFASNDIPSTATLILQIRTTQYRSSDPTMAVMRPEPLHSLDRLLLKFSPSQSVEATHAFITASVLPPITAASLQPLSVGGFFNMPDLRYLMNFDMEAHVGPADDIVHMTKHPDLTRKMVARDKQYWSAIQYELEARTFLAHNEPQPLQCLPNRMQSIFEQQSRIHRMFDEIRDLALLSVPGEQEVRAVLDPDLRMQEVIQGQIPSFRKLANWFRERLLKQCAIKRDEMVNRLCDDMRDLADSGDAHAVCLVMQGLFSVLHVLKLDIANHQIKANRPRVMQENSMFFQTHYEKRIRLETFHPLASVTWFNEPSPSLPPVLHFVSKTVSSLFQCMPGQSTQEVFPSAWEYDYGGLDSVLAGIETLIAVEICLRSLPTVLAHLGNSDLIERATDLLRVTLPTVVGESSWQSAAGNIAIEIFQAADDKQHRLALTPAISEPSGIAPTSYGIPCISLASGTAPTADRAITTEHTYAPLSTISDVKGSVEDRPTRCIPSSILPLLEKIEHNLYQDLNPEGQVLQEQLIATHDSLSAKLSKPVWQSYQLKPWQLSNMFVGPTQDPERDGNQDTFGARSYAHERVPQPGGPTMDDLVNRLTHILVLHWQWAGPLIYAPGRSGVFDPIREPGWDVMAGYQQGLDDVPVVRDLVYPGPEAAQRLLDVGYTGQVYVGGSQDNEWWDHRHGTGRVSRRHFAHSTDQDEDSNPVGEQASSSGRSRPAAR